MHVFRRSHTGRPSIACLVQALDTRVLRSGTTYSYDGSGNNLANPLWGSTGATLVRLAAPAFTDGISTPAGAARPSTRLISNDMMIQRGDDIFESRQLSDFGYAWGQFVDHDMDLTSTGNVPFNIAVPEGDLYFDPRETGTQVIPMNRSLTVSGTGVTTPLQFANEITGFLDGSVVYGSDAIRADALRAHVGGRMATTDGPDGELMPLNTGLLPNQTGGPGPAGYFLGGDIRSNENSEVTVIDALLVRNHNRLAGELATMHPDWNDEQLFQEARKLNIATIQQITYNEYLPALMGGNAMSAYAGYDPTVNAGVSLEFSAAAFRFGHSMLGNDVQFFDDDGNESADALKMFEILFNPQIVKDNGIDSLLKYLNTNNSEENDLKMVDSIRNILFGLPGQGGLDLAAIDTQRGRDEGLADYNTTRVALGLPAVTSFAQITSNPFTQHALQALYGTVDNVDLFVGGEAEDHSPGSSLGQTFQAILVNQFTRTRAGDRLWYQNSLTADEMGMIQGTTLTDLLKLNTSLRNIQDNSFFFDAEVAGTVFTDSNRNGILDAGDVPLAGQRVYLLDDDEGGILDFTDTSPDGTYAFKDIQVGNFSAVMFPPANIDITTPDQASHNVSKGEIFGGNDFGLAPVFTHGTLGPPLDTPIAGEENPPSKYDGSGDSNVGTVLAPPPSPFSGTPIPPLTSGGLFSPDGDDDLLGGGKRSILG